jgi:hypothetical protein
MTDVVTPHFAELSGKGFIFNNPMTKITTIECDTPLSQSKEHVHSSLGCTPQKTLYWRDDFSGERSTKAQCLADQVGFLGPGNFAKDINGLAITDAFSAIGGASLNGLATLYEGEKTVTSMVQILVKLIAILRNVKRFNLKALAGQLSPKEIRDFWLAARYAIRPLVYDTKGVIDAIKKIKGGKIPNGRQTYRSSGMSEDIESNDVVEITHTNAVHEVVYRYDRSVKSTAIARAGVLVNAEGASALNVLGLDLVAETVWEEIPFSFLVDWIFNVGKTIAAWTPNVGFKALASWVVTETVTVQEIKVGVSSIVCKKSGTCESLLMSQNGEYSKTTITKTRSPNPSRPIIPDLNIRLDTAKLIDLLAIASHYV